MQKIIIRKNLNKEFKKISKYNITVVTAPMGYGKTVGIIEYFQKNNLDYIWLSLESHQNDINNIWDVFCRQIECENTYLSKELYNLGFPCDQKKYNYFIKLINNIDSSIILVIDDYHFCQCSELDNLMEKLIKSNINNLNVVLLSRHIPKINITELKLKDMCYVIDFKYFILSLNEISEYFFDNNIPVSKENLKKISEISEGWISAVKLIAEKYERTRRVDKVESLESLLVYSIINAYDAYELQLITKLSILDVFTLKQASYILYEKENTILKIISKNNFIRYDEKNDNYKTHNILNNILRNKYLENINDINDVYLRCGIWNVDNNNKIEGINNFLKIKDYAMVLQEFEKETGAFLFDKYPGIMYNIFDKIPNEHLIEVPIAYMNYISFLVTSYDAQKGIEEFRKFLDIFNTRGRYLYTKDKIKIITGEIEFLTALTKHNNVFDMEKHLKNAYELLPNKSVTANSNKLSTTGCISLLYCYFRVGDDLKETCESFSKGFYYYELLSNGCGRGILDLTMAEYYLETLDIYKARIYAEKSYIKAKTLNQYDVMLVAKFVLARTYIYKQEYKKAVELIKTIDFLDIVIMHPLYNCQYELILSYISIKCDKKDITNWIKEEDFNKSRLFYNYEWINTLLYSMYLLDNKEYIKLEVMCEQGLDETDRYKNAIGKLHFYIMDSIAKYNLYEIDEAKSSIEKAVTIGEKDDIYLIIIEYGKVIKNIIEKSNINTEYTQKIISEIEQKEKEILSKREKQVLDLMVEGESNKEIAEILFVAEITIKKTTSKIYKKLGYKNRKDLLANYIK